LSDGKHKIAFIDHPMDPDGSVREDNDLFIVNTDGTGYQNLTNTPDVSEGYLGDTGSIAWSPDASFLALANCNDVVIYRIVPNGGSFSAESQGGVIRVPGSPIANTGCVVDVDWANAVDKLVVSANEPGTGTYDLWVVDVFSPTNVSQLMRTPNNFERECSWSPADAQITYIQGPSGGIWVINSDGTGAKQIVGPVKRVSYARPQWRRNL
jgi:Tol biopolymer transport system component